MKGLFVWMTLLCAGSVYGQYIPLPGLRPDMFLRDSARREPYLTVQFAPAEPFMVSRIAYIGDFQKRFNHQTTPAGQAMNDSLRATVSRRECIESLFDQFDARLNAQKGSDSGYRRAKELLIQQILYGEMYLPDIDSSLFATLDFSATYRGKEVNGVMFLKRAKARFGYSWQVFDVDAPFLPKTRDEAYAKTALQDSAYHMINPHAHETNFLSLYGLLQSGVPLLKLATCGQDSPGSVVALSKAIQAKECGLDQFQVSLFVSLNGGLALKLNDFNRATDNSGWLVSDIFSEYSASRLPEAFSRYFPDLQIRLKPSFK